MKRNKKRTASIKRKKFSFPGEALHTILKVLKEDWVETAAEAPRGSIKYLAIFVITENCGGIRGEEVPCLYLKGILSFWEETRHNKRPHIMFTLKGGFKGKTRYR